MLSDLCCTRGQHLRIATEALDGIEATFAGAIGAGNRELQLKIKNWMRRSPTAGLPNAVVFGEVKASPKPSSPPSPLKTYPRRSARIASVKYESNITNIVTYKLYYQPGSHNATKSAETLIRENLHHPLRKSELEDGFVYVFWRKGDFGLIKIGYTTNATSARLADWQRQCGNDNEDCGAEDRSSQVRVRNVKRVEALVHAELKQYRRKQYGCRCKKVQAHVEWFEVDIALAQKVVEKWTTWLHERPRYEPRENGKLLELEDGEAERLCVLVQLPSLAKLGAPSAQRRRSSRLRNKANAQYMTDTGPNPWDAVGQKKTEVKVGSCAYQSREV